MENYYKNALKQIIEFLNVLEETQDVKYYLVGGILVNIYADYRDTRDIDLAIDFHSSKININDYINLLQENGFNPFQDWISTKLLADETKIIQFMDKSDTVRYDNHIIERFGRNKFKKMGPLGLQRRVREKKFGIECWVASKEDFILSKLLYGG